MNRIQLLEQSGPTNKPTPSARRRQFKLSPAGERSAQSLESRGLEAQSSGAQSFFVPLHYEPNYAYPLVVWLHGPGGCERQLRQVMPHISTRNYVGAAACAPSAAGESAHWSQTATGIAQALARVEACVEEAQSRFRIAAHRVFLAGLDCGGTMAIRLGLAAPERFAGVASIGGPFPEGNHPMSNLTRARKLPILIAQGRDSEDYPIQRVCDELRLFHAAGMTLNLRQYPCGQELTTQMLSDLDVWMMQIVTGIDMTATVPAAKPEELN